MTDRHKDRPVSFRPSGYTKDDIDEWADQAGKTRNAFISDAVKTARPKTKRSKK